MLCTSAIPKGKKKRRYLLPAAFLFTLDATIAELKWYLQQTTNPVKSSCMSSVIYRSAGILNPQ